MFAGIAGAIFGSFLKLVPGLADSYFKFLKDKADTETERIKIMSVENTEVMHEQASTIRTAMGFRVFWVAWSLAALPFSAWLGWGYMDSLFNGGLPDVAALPPQLKEYGDIVIRNIFVSGGVVAAVQAGSRTIASGMASRPAVREVKEYRLPQGGK